jgi:hypothetical protein
VNVATTVAGAQQPSKAETELATALAAKHVALLAGITSAAAKGTPISAKYEFEDGKLQLSVYTEKAGEFFEVVVDHKSGKVAKAEKITNAGDLTNAKAQSEAIAKAKQSLKAAVAKAVAGNPGYDVVGATAGMAAGQPAAEITLHKGRTFKTVSEPLT